MDFLTMTSNSSNLENAPVKNRPGLKSAKSKKMSQERVMIMFTLFFIAGILLLVIIPEEHAARGWAMGSYSIIVFWAVFRFGI
jgi:hypothetical protein